MGFDKYEIDGYVHLSIFMDIKVNFPESCWEHWNIMRAPTHFPVLGKSCWINLQ